ncbi:glycosyltransferase [Peribacillus frigoritolerans]|uniref:glycosyltransferase n=1 Tax=Peribacillus frigoritolerans TaxID=450367 RepID=UPI0021AAB71C|nr:glycosyltransferase [Peribacillus frigoritolerans]MCT4478536.1 glycosyltransferase [Peribacillus frigoritolerans]
MVNDTNKPTIFFLINSMHGGGAEKVVANLTLALEPKYNVYILLLNKQTSEDYTTGGQIIVLDDGIRRNKIQQYIFYKKEIEYLSKKYNPKVIISFLLNACLCNIIAKTRVKKILSIRNYLKKQFSGKRLFFWEFCFKYLFTKSDIVVSVSNSMEDDLVKNYNLRPEKSKVISNPYFIESLINAMKEPIEDEYLDFFSSRVIVNIGSLHKQKGQCHLIRAFAELKKYIPDLKLVIIGKGTNSEFELELKKLAQDLKVDKEVLFLGHQSNPHKYLKSATVFAFPSLYEGFPNALVEAMICGVPIISTDCETGPREILAPSTPFSKKAISIEEAEYGILVPTDKKSWLNADEPLTKEESLLVIALQEILTNKEKFNYYKKASKKRGYDFSIDNVLFEWEKIL